MSFGALTFVSLGALSVISSIAVARVYGIEVMGEAALVLAPSLALQVLSTVREQVALIRKISVLEVRDPRITGLWIATLAFSTALAATAAALVAVVTHIVFTGPVGRPDLFLPAVAVLVGNVCIGTIGWNFDSVFAGFRAGREMFLVRLGQALAFVVVAVGLGIAWGTVWGVVVATVASYALALGLRLAWVPSYMRFRVSADDVREGFRTLPELLAFGVRVAPGFVAESLSPQANVWILGASQPIAAVGAWGRAWQIYARLAQATTRTTEVLLPTLVERRRAGDATGYDRSLIDSLRYSTVGLLLAGTVGSGAAVGIMQLFGPGFDQAATGLAILFALPALSSASALLSTCLLAENRPGRTTVVSISQALAMVGSAFALIPPLGITGGALATAIGGAVGLAGLAFAARRHLSTRVRDWWRPIEMLALALACVAGFTAARLIDSALAGIAGLVPALIAGTLAYTASFLLCGGVNARDRERLRSLRAQRRARAPGAEVTAAAPEPSPVTLPEPDPLA